MKTQIEHARNGTITPEMRKIARIEHTDAETLRNSIAQGQAIIMTRDNHLCGIGRGLKTRVNVNLGTSTAAVNTGEEVEKAKVAEAYGADTITDLSMGGNITAIRREIIKHTTLPLTTVPIYQCVAEHGWAKLTATDLLSQIEEHVREGISSIVLHFITPQLLQLAKSSGRILPMVSKGGSFTSLYMLKNHTDNPFLQHFDEILQILKERDVVLSLGNTLRSGCIHDAPDEAQRAEITLNANLAERANNAGVQAIIEGMGGHVAPTFIPEYVRYHKQIADRPLFVAGPLPSDVAVGYDHIAASIGAAMAAGAGADYLCTITPAEHLHLPTCDDIREGLIAFKIAAHIADNMKYTPSEKDRMLSIHRSRLDWPSQLRYAIEPKRALELYPRDGKCTMCGEYCALKTMREYLQPCNQ